jgi:hypothetical protein
MFAHHPIFTSEEHAVVGGWAHFRGYRLLSFAVVPSQMYRLQVITHPDEPLRRDQKSSIITDSVSGPQSAAVRGFDAMVRAREQATCAHVKR